MSWCLLVDLRTTTNLWTMTVIIAYKIKTESFQKHTRSVNTCFNLVCQRILKICVQFWDTPPRIDLGVSFRIHNGFPSAHILSQIHPVHIFHKHLLIHCSITLPPVYKSSKWALILRCSGDSSVWVSLLSHVCYIPFL
jgi:hypothetical protein